MFEDNKFPFALVEDIKLDGHYRDIDNEVYKYKIEYNKDRLKTSKMPNNMRVDNYVVKRYYNRKVFDDVVSNANIFNTKTHIELIQFLIIKKLIKEVFSY